MATNKPGKPTQQNQQTQKPSDADKKRGQEVVDAVVTTMAAAVGVDPAAIGVKPTLDIDHDAQSDETQALAQRMYEAYIANSGGLNYEGKPCPTWQNLTHAVRSHWCAAAIEAWRSSASVAKFDLELAKDELDKLRAELAGVQTQVDALRNAPAPQLVADAHEQLKRELTAARHDIVGLQQQLDQEKARTSVDTTTHEYEQLKYVAGRANMLEREVDKLRGELAAARAAK